MKMNKRLIPLMRKSSGLAGKLLDRLGALIDIAGELIICFALGLVFALFFLKDLTGFLPDFSVEFLRYAAAGLIGLVVWLNEFGTVRRVEPLARLARKSILFLKEKLVRA